MTFLRQQGGSNLRREVLGLVLLLAGGGPLQGQGQETLARYEFLQIRMAVPVRILVYARDEASAIQATDAAYARIRELDRILSDYDPDSELMQLSRQPVGEPVPVSSELFEVLAAAHELSQRSDGAFDVTVGPVVKLWRVARRRKTLPDPDRLEAARQAVGYQKVILDQRSRQVTLQQAGIELDVGGIAKGYAADEALETLSTHDITRALVAVAGDIRVGDPPPEADAWKVEVEQPSATEDADPLILYLRNQAVSTSGDTYQFVEIDGVRYSHIVDPQTGLGLTVPGSVTVVAPTGMQADGLASTVNVLGPDRGRELINSLPHIEARIVQLQPDDQPVEFSTPGWSRLTRAPASSAGIDSPPCGEGQKTGKR